MYSWGSDCCLLHTGWLLGLFFNPEYGTKLFLRNVELLQRNAWCCIPELRLSTAARTSDPTYGYGFPDLLFGMWYSSSSSSSSSPAKQDFSAIGLVMRCQFFGFRDNYFAEQGLQTCVQLLIWRIRSLYLRLQVTGRPSYTPRHRAPFPSPSTTDRAAVEVFLPASKREECYINIFFVFPIENWLLFKQGIITLQFRHLARLLFENVFCEEYGRTLLATKRSPFVSICG
jgi:hypothetical protein